MVAKSALRSIGIKVYRSAIIMIEDTNIILSDFFNLITLHSVDVKRGVVTVHSRQNQSYK